MNPDDYSNYTLIIGFNKSLLSILLEGETPLLRTQMGWKKCPY